MPEGLQELPVFVAVVEEAGFRAAGRRLGVTGSAVSHAVKRLEEKVGITLANLSILKRGKARAIRAEH